VVQGSAGHQVEEPSQRGSTQVNGADAQMAR
jgi:hypothetical protein